MAHNPYAVTKRDVSSRELEEQVARPLGLLITAVINVIVPTLVALFGHSTVEQYRNTLQGMGSDVSAPATFLLGSSWVWWALALGALAMAVWVGKAATVTRLQQRAMKVRVRAFTVLMGLLIAVSIYSLYTSVLKVSEVV